MYFSYSSATPSDIKANILGTKGEIHVRYYKKKFSKQISKGKIIRITRKEARKADDGIKYQKGIYFKGNFKKTYKFLEKQIKHVPKYSLFGKAVKSYIKDIPFVGSMSPTNSSDMGRNCMQLVAQALRKGNIEHSLSTNIYEELKKANKNPIPNLMYKTIHDLEKRQLVFRTP